MASDKSLQGKLRERLQKGDIVSVSRLLKGGVSVNDVTWFDTTLLHEAVSHYPPPSAVTSKGCRDPEKVREELIEVLLRNGADPNSRDKNARTPLHYVARRGDSMVVEQLHRAGASINALTEDGRSPLHVALWQNRESTARKLIDLGADVNLADQDGTTPLHWAVKKDQVDLMMQMLKRGAAINAQDKKGWSPLHHSISARTDIMRILLTQGADMTLRTRSNQTVMNLLDQSLSSASHDCKEKAALRFKMLVHSGYPIHLDHKLVQRKLRLFQVLPEMSDWLSEMEEKCPLNLLHLCRLCIRRHLTNIRGDAMLDEKLFQLQGVLPEALIKSLWMIDDFVELKSLT